MSPDEIVTLRERLGLSQTELAERVGVVYSTVWRWETGQVEPSPLALRLLRHLEAQPASPSQEVEGVA